MRINVNVLRTTSLCFCSLDFQFHRQGFECLAVETDVRVGEFLLPMNRDQNGTGQRCACKAGLAAGWMLGLWCSVQKEG